MIFDFLNDCQIESNWENLTDSCTIKLPSKLGIDKDNLKDKIRKGDKVSVSFGYDDQLTEIFTGYVSFVKPSTPVEIQCEDEMWKLKQLKVDKYYEGGDLSEFLSDVFTGYDIDAYGINLAPIHFVDVNGAKVLDQIKSDYRLYSFFRNGVLTVGKQYDPALATKHTFKLDYNMVSDDLVFKEKDDLIISVKGISNLANGEKIEVEIGETGGDTTTLNFFNLGKEDLKKAAEKEFERLVYDGFRGSFTAFGEPIVKHGDIVNLIHNEESDKSGEYWVDGIVYSIGLGGIRQDITLGART